MVIFLIQAPLLFLPPLPVLQRSQVHSASNANQKEKYEADLKKEIKKLQVGSLNRRERERESQI